MTAYADGDSAAFRELFERYSSRLLGLMMRGMASTRDAQDLVQRTFLQLHRARHDFRPGARLRPWLMTIALNVKRQYLRTSRRRPEAPLELDGRSDPAVAPHDPELAERTRLLRQTLAELPAKQREVIELHWLEGIPMLEVAEIVGASRSAVKVRAHRGYARLRELLSARGVTGLPGLDYTEA